MSRLKKYGTWLTGLLLAVILAGPVGAQTITGADDGTTLEQIIVFGRHSVRSTTASRATLATYAVDPYPEFGVPPGYLTTQGQQAATLMGSYFRDYLLHERLLTGNARVDAARSYFRANSIQRSNVTAARFGAGLIPGASIAVHSFPLGQTDPVFDPLGAAPLGVKVASVDSARAELDVQGIFNSGDALGSAYSQERALVRSVLFNYPPGTQPPPDMPAVPPGLVDVGLQKVLLDANTTELVTGNVIGLGGLATTENAADAFVMEYADGLPPDQVAWGRLSLEALSQQTRLVTVILDIVMRSPYLARVQSSNAAAHVLRTMEQAVIGENILGAFGNASARTIVVISSDAYVAGLAGLLNLHWILPGYQPDFCAPGGALVFELRRVRRSRGHVVRAFYTAQTFDQLRNLTPLTLESPPATQQLLIPVEGRSGWDPEVSPVRGRRSGADLDVGFDAFRNLLRRAIDRKCVEDPLTEVPPGVLTDVPLS